MDRNTVEKIDFDPLSKEVVDVAFHIHQSVGAGLLESIYQECFELSLLKRGIPFERQISFPVRFEGQELNTALRLDLVVKNQIVVELKSVENIISAHTAQMLTYMRMGGFNTGLLINFGEPYFKKAIRRFVL